METTTQVVSNVMSETQVTAITSALTDFGNTLLDYFVQLLPAIATIAAIMFVIYIIKNKVRA